MRFSLKKLPAASSPLPLLRLGGALENFSPTALFQLEKNLQHAPLLVAAGMPLLLGLIILNTKKQTIKNPNYLLLIDLKMQKPFLKFIV